MKTLYLLRHAEADGGSGLSDGDHGRPLSIKGRAEGRAVGTYMQAQGMVPQQVLCSDAARTLSTARLAIEEIFGNEKNPVPSQFDRNLYLAPPDVVLSSIQAMDAAVEKLLVVGHNPGMAELAMLLSGRNADQLDGFPPATLAVFETTVDDWALLDTGNTTLVTVFTPEF